jgi:hypothetical protein
LPPPIKHEQSNNYTWSSPKPPLLDDIHEGKNPTLILVTSPVEKKSSSRPRSGEVIS